MLYKPNWEETKRRFVRWWDLEGPVLSTWGRIPAARPLETLTPVADFADPAVRYSDPEYRILKNRSELAVCDFPAEVLPNSITCLGPGTLALYLGSEPHFTEETVWYDPVIRDPERHPPLRFDRDSRWWKITEATVRESLRLGKGKFLTGLPDLIENIDILASLRGSEDVLFDMSDRPEWVMEKMKEINAAWFEAFNALYGLIAPQDDGSAWGPFQVWSPGRTAKLQCDASAMFGPKMFERFVVPVLTEQCRGLDRSMFHLDGHQCLVHLDLLLGIRELSAIEWTPDPQVPSGGNREWYPLYRKILSAGKAVQAIGIKLGEIEPLLDAVGGKGLYLMMDTGDPAVFEQACRIVDKYR
jgi:hypothetical protein